MKLENIAICLYGQYRTGDICVPHIKDMIDMIDGVNIDYFCSVKNSVSYHTPDGTVNMSDSKTITEKEKRQIKKNLKNILSPKFINFIDDEKYYKKLAGRTRNDFLIFSGIIDSLLLKQRHESKTGKFYDAVILLRYDFMMRPLDYISKLVREITQTNDLKVFSNDPDKFFALQTNDPYLFGGCHPYTLFPNSIGDLILLFTGSAADRICVELIDFVNSVTGFYLQKSDHKYDTIPDLYDCHTMLTYLSNRISVPISDMPLIEKFPIEENEYSGKMHPLEEKANCDLTKMPILAVSRPSVKIDKCNPTVDKDFDYIMNLWVIDPKTK